MTALALTLGCAGAGMGNAPDAGAPGLVESQPFQRRVIYDDAGRYMLFLPAHYGRETRRWPLLLFLHGAGERGDSLPLVLVHGPLKPGARQPDLPFIVAAPQVPDGGTWQTDVLDAVLADVTARYAVDPDRIYLSGLSMGGFGTWKMAIRYPHRFAAIAPVSGGGERWAACSLKDTPVWVFHGAKDDVVPLARAEEMVKALKECGGSVRFTIYPDAGHDAWTETYANPELYTWMLQHRRRPDTR